MAKKGMTYNYELIPVRSESRKDLQDKKVSGTLIASNYANATYEAGEKARKLSAERGEEYGIGRIY